MKYLINLIMLLVFQIKLKISVADAKNDQTEIKSNLSEIKKGNKKH